MVLLYATLAAFCIAGSSSNKLEESTVAQPMEIAVAVSPSADADPLIASEGKDAEPEVKELPGNVRALKLPSPVTTSEYDWSYFCLVLALTFVISAVRVVQTPRRGYLAAGFILSLLQFLIPYLWISSFGLVGLLGCTGFLIHFLAPKHLAEKSVFLGIGLAFFAYSWSPGD